MALPKDKNISIRPPKGKEALKGKLIKVAAQNNRSLNEYCIGIFEAYLKKPFKVF